MQPDRLTIKTQEALQAALALAPARRHSQVTPLHLLAAVLVEDGFLQLLGGHDLPIPRTNLDVAGDKVDCHWPQRELTVELLSYRFHGSRHAFEADIARRRRSNHVAFSYGDVFERGAQTAAEVAEILAHEA